MPPCKMSPDTVVHKVELPGKFPNRAAGTPKSPLCPIKEIIT
jgi:hypothetical protein